jgi:chitosanase
MLNDLQKRSIEAIVNVFETGRPTGDYASVTVAPDDPGHLTYGRSQATLSSGNLARLVREYRAEPGALLAQNLSVYLPRLEARDLSLDADAALRALLRGAGADPAMRRTQDAFFDRAYWEPALRAAQALGIGSALGTGVVYDSFVHGAWARLRDATAHNLGLGPGMPQVHPGGADEAEWIGRYITLRRNWLATHPNALLRRAVYRMETFAALVAAGNWELHLPIEAHGVTITEQELETPLPAGSAALTL